MLGGRSATYIGVFWLGMILSLAKGTMLISNILLVVVPALVHRRDPPSVVMTSRRGLLERTVLWLVTSAFLLTLA